MREAARHGLKLRRLPRKRETSSAMWPPAVGLRSKPRWRGHHSSLSPPGMVLFVWLKNGTATPHFLAAVFVRKEFHKMRIYKRKMAAVTAGIILSGCATMRDVEGPQGDNDPF